MPIFYSIYLYVQLFVSIVLIKGYKLRGHMILHACYTKKHSSQYQIIRREFRQKFVQLSWQYWRLSLSKFKYSWLNFVSFSSPFVLFILVHAALQYTRIFVGANGNSATVCLLGRLSYDYLGSRFNQNGNQRFCGSIHKQVFP